MSKKNLPPFYVGQKVVAVSTPRNKVYKTGDEKIILGLIFHCKEWYVDIGLAVRSGIGTRCDHCGGRMNENFVWFCYASHFKPIEEKFQSVSLTKVLETETPFVGIN